uniref:ATPase subunit 8 n=1 Tax=Polydora cf. ciliata DS-2023 TaxID=3033393 RepID=A0AA95EJH3_9ANNE|nr:ATPase subunit 8 [Polydora cf. ciliata DS-2023]
MPHFFLPIDWVLSPSVIIMALLATTALIYWAVPELKFPQAPKSPIYLPSLWTHISES